jgi:hypothetical protein
MIDAALSYMPGCESDADTLALLVSDRPDVLEDDSLEDDTKEDESSISADNLLMRPLPIGSKVEDGRVITVYESSVDALERARATWKAELVHLLAMGSLATDAERKRIRQLRYRLDEPEQEPRFSYSTRIPCSVSDALEYILTDADDTDTPISLQTQFAVARGQFAEFEANLIDAIDRSK